MTTPTAYRPPTARATGRRILLDLEHERVSLLDAAPDELDALDLAGIAGLHAALGVLELALGPERSR